jgi:hypothetical protein
MVISVVGYAQTGLQIGMVGSTIFNSNRNTNVFPFSPIIGYEIGTVYQHEFLPKLWYRLELGYASKGALQSNGPIAKNFAKYVMGYGFASVGIGYALSNASKLYLSAQPSYLLLYKKYENGGVNNFYQSITNRFKLDLPLAIGLSTKVNKMHELTARFAAGTSPYATTVNVFPTPSVDRFYHLHASVLYTFYFPQKSSSEE